jgi:hypothetical protein
LLAGIAILVGCLLLGCSHTAPTPQPPSPVDAQARDAAFVLRIAATKPRYQPNEPIQVTTWLTYVGPRAKITIRHSGSGPVIVNVEQIDGPFDPGSAAEGDCSMSTLERRVPLQAPYRKTGGFSNDDPLAAQYREFFADDLLRLPRGTYRLTATVDVYEEECGAVRHNITAAITIGVGL